MTNCPPSLRGDLSKWLCEINTGVYVGNVSSRVRDAIWDRVCENLKNGQATLVFNTNNEQRMDFRTHNTSWEAVDFEGIKLMRRPLPRTQAPAADLKPGFSNAAKRQMAQKMARKKAAAPVKEESYTVIDLETTGLNAASDAIVEYGALRVRDGQPAEEFSALVRGTEPLPDVVAKLTGITPEALAAEGIEKAEAAFDAKKAAELEQKLKSNKFTLSDFYDQLSQLKNMGSLDEIAAMMPGMNAGALKGAQVDEKAMARTAAIIQSMTPYERENPSVLNSSRKRRIALGSGVKVEDINKLLKQFDMMNQMMKQFSGPGASRKMKRMGKLGGMGGLGGFPGL